MGVLVLIAGGACGGDGDAAAPGSSHPTTSDVPLPGGGDGGDESAPDSGSAEAGRDAGKSDASVDASAPADWTVVVDALTLGAALGVTAPNRLYADPVTPAHLLIGSSPSIRGPIAIEWLDGSLHKALVWTGNVDQNAPPSTVLWKAGGIDGSGRSFAYVCCFPEAVGGLGQNPYPWKLATASPGGGWTWNAMHLPNGLPSSGGNRWPPAIMALAATNTGRDIFTSGSDAFTSGSEIFDTTGHLEDSVPWPVGTSNAKLNFLSFYDDTHLVAFVTTRTGAIEVRRCSLNGANLACDATAATGIVAGQVPTMLRASKNGSRVYAATMPVNASGGTTYASTDGGVSFSAVQLPPWGVDWDVFSFSPAAPDTLAVHMPAYQGTGPSGVNEGLFVTKNRGVAWTKVELPKSGGTTTSFQGMAFDAAGDLYLVYGSALFRTTP
ncbi:hypothetical protein AKJ09_01966 [Labilithrix luteola]|uniref:Uncharacterized protein n=1 Tax=Labilithrix luteola TaxID=1391654 RepID=A0A0K1PP66_9BACT|nr:hypothetical protein AKJ09_01966 [Labilithrix luteola]